MKGLKALLIVIPIVIISLGVYIGFSTQSTTYICSSENSSKISTNIFVSIEKYHPWVSFLSDAHGKLIYKVPIKESGSYNYQSNDTETLTLYKEDITKIEGSYSIKKNRLFLKTKNSFFEGKCRLLNDHCSNNIMH